MTYGMSNNRCIPWTSLSHYRRRLLGYWARARERWRNQRIKFIQPFALWHWCMHCLKRNKKEAKAQCRRSLSILCKCVYVTCQSSSSPSNPILIFLEQINVLSIDVRDKGAADVNFCSWSNLPNQCVSPPMTIIVTQMFDCVCQG